MGLNSELSRNDWNSFFSDYIPSLSIAKNELVSEKKVPSVINNEINIGS